jgi:hypothetical protein
MTTHFPASKADHPPNDRSTVRPTAGRAGPDEAGGPVIETRRTAAGTRVSTIRRPDGSTLVVTVPADAMDDDGGGCWAKTWITGDGAAREPSVPALRRLASAITAGPSPAPALRLGVPRLAIR